MTGSVGVLGTRMLRWRHSDGEHRSAADTIADFTALSISAEVGQIEFGW